MTDWWPWLRDLGRKHLAGILAAVAVVGLVYWGRLEGLEHWSLDKLFEWRGPRHPTLPVVIVTIDESSMAELNEPWPFPRALDCQFIVTIALGQPSETAVDIMFLTPSCR